MGRQVSYQIIRRSRSIAGAIVLSGAVATPSLARADDRWSGWLFAIFDAPTNAVATATPSESPARIAAPVPEMPTGSYSYEVTETPTYVESPTVTATYIPEICGDGILQQGEECDDGALEPNDGCSPSCRIERCGDASLQPWEQCDDGNVGENDGCTAYCQIERCGDGIVQSWEGCDDGNELDGDGCSGQCWPETFDPITSSGPEQTPSLQYPVEMPTGGSDTTGDACTDNGCAASCTDDAGALMELLVAVCGPDLAHCGEEPGNELLNCDVKEDGRFGPPPTPKATEMILERLKSEKEATRATQLKILKQTSGTAGLKGKMPYFFPELKSLFEGESKATEVKKNAAYLIKLAIESKDDKDGFIIPRDSDAYKFYDTNKKEIDELAGK